MCGRFTQRCSWNEILDLYGLAGPARNLQPRYNIAPTDPVHLIKSVDGGGTELVPMRWGLIPYWWKKPVKQLPATFNARAERLRSRRARGLAPA
jgi:putative SOS response-associated peptidase YedK